MVTIPQQFGDAFELANNTIAGTSKQEFPGFGAPIPPSQSGFGVRGNRIPSERSGVLTRNMVRWFVPEIGIVEMYINPQNISYQFKKHITNQRTKGGYLLQYWGEDLTQLTISGTTGSSGVEGVNVLHDVYRSEQLAFDPYALALASERDAESNDQGFIGRFGNFLEDTGTTDSFFNLLTNSIETGNSNTTRSKPTLASLAFSVEMYYAGWVFRGYFTDFKLEEKAERIGLFDYSMTFFVTQRRGLRLNFFPWHRSATDGPSNSDPEFGPPHSFVNLGLNAPIAVPPQEEEGGLSLVDSLAGGLELITDSFSSIF